MGDVRFDVVGVGHALVDVLVHADDALLKQQGMAKGAMTLIDAERADALYGVMPPAIEMSGGSCANTMHGIAALGGRAAYLGKVSGDQLGDVFAHDIQAAGVSYDVRRTAEAATGRCLIFVTPDAQRTMNTYLGAASLVDPDDIIEETVAASLVLYMEGYLWDPPLAKQAFLKAARVAHDAGRKVSLTLSDPFCVDRHRDSFLELVEHHIDILFANEAEIISLYRTPTFDAALQHVRGHCEIAVLTRSEKGSVVVAGESVHVIDAEPVDEVVDTTGAGDLYAAGFLYGLTRGRDLQTCARIGAIAAAEVISHFGARPEQPLADLVRQRLDA